MEYPRRFLNQLNQHDIRLSVISGGREGVNEERAFYHSTLIDAKTVPPRIPADLVHRPHLIDHLNRITDRPLTVLSAEAGSGKTVLLSDWVRSLDLPVTWLSLDARDNNPMRFWYCCLTAIQQADNVIARQIQPLRETLDTRSIETIAETLINIFSSLKQPIIIVLDNYHLITAHSIHQTIHTLLLHCSQQLRFVISTRVQPPLPPSLMYSQARMEELHSKDLRFTVDETLALLQQSGHTSYELAAILCHSVEGWVMGLRMLLPTLRSPRTSPASIADIARYQPAIYNYIIDEIFHRQPPHIQSTLLQTSLLESFNSALCDAVIDKEPGTGQRVLERLDQANLLHPTTHKTRQWYRYNRIVAQILQQYLMKHQNWQVTIVHQRASEWYEQHGALPEAIQHWLAIEEYERASQLITRAVIPAVIHRSWSLLERWRRALPRTSTPIHPIVTLCFAWGCIHAGQFSVAEAYIKDIENQINTIEHLAYSVTLQAYMSQRKGKNEHAIALFGHALDCLPHDNIELRVMLHMHFGLACMDKGSLTEAYELFTNLKEMAYNQSTTLIATCYQARALLEQGRIAEAEPLFLQVIQLIDDNPFAYRSLMGYVQVGLGIVLYRKFDLCGAEYHLKQGMNIAQESNDTETALEASLFLLQLRRVQNPGEDLLPAVEMLEQRVKQYCSPYIAASIDALTIQAYLDQGQDSSAMCHAHKREPWYLPQSDQMTVFSLMVRKLSRGRIHLAQQSPLEALPLLQVALEIAEQSCATGWMIEIMMLRALALYEQGACLQAFKSFEQGLVLAAAESYIQPLFSDKQIMVELLGYVQQTLNDSEVSFAPAPLALLQRLFDTYGRQKETPPATPVPESLQPHDSLSSRELEVLQLIASGLSNREISKKLIITEGTVKRHVNNILGKLQANSRTHAVAIAHDLNLLNR